MDRHGLMGLAVRVGLHIIGIRPEEIAVFHHVPGLKAADLRAPPGGRGQDAPGGPGCENRGEAVDEHGGGFVRLGQAGGIPGQEGQGRILQVRGDPVHEEDFVVPKTGGDGTILQKLPGQAAGDIDIGVQGLDGGDFGLREDRGLHAGDLLIAQGEGGVPGLPGQAHGRAHQGGRGIGVGTVDGADPGRAKIIQALQDAVGAGGFGNGAGAGDEQDGMELQLIQMGSQGQDFGGVGFRGEDAIEIVGPVEDGIQAVGGVAVGGIEGDIDAVRRRGRGEIGFGSQVGRGGGREVTGGIGQHVLGGGEETEALGIGDGGGRGRGEDQAGGKGRADGRSMGGVDADIDDGIQGQHTGFSFQE